MTDHTPTTAEEREVLQKLCDEAVPGPWVWSKGSVVSGPELLGNIKHSDSFPILITWGCSNNDGVGCMPDKFNDELCNCPLHPIKRDRDFIVAARSAMPRLLKDIERLNTQVQDLESEILHLSELD